MAEHARKLTLSARKSVHIVVLLELVIPLLVLITILCIKVLENSDLDKHSDDNVTTVVDHDIYGVLHDFGLTSLYCLHLAVKIFLGCFLWTAAQQKCVRKLIVWCLASGVLTCIGLAVCGVAVAIPPTKEGGLNNDISLFIIPTALGSILCVYSVIVVMVQVRRIRIRARTSAGNGQDFDYDECMSVSFTPKYRSVVSLAPGYWEESL